ncbi:Smr/MutS family protein [Snuella lapsa]|uniref:Smr domain-containing protein n=1 Tax=Snuella lapsa TaxID=870481 RepID=A0ABP6YC47_9FLAO
MVFDIGDRVLVLDEAITGVVKQIEGKTVILETEDGFLLTFKAEELVLDKEDKVLKNGLFSGKTVDSVIIEKEHQRKRKQPKTKVKERYEPLMEVDLHINQLVRSTRGMSNHDILTLQLDTARRQLEYAMSKRIQKVVFIHGVGEGVLRIELEYLFGRYNNVKFYDANYQKYGLGATEVYIYQNVPN